MSKKSLVLYYSQSGNTEEIATFISNSIKSDLCRIEALHAYPENYDDLVARVHKELEQKIDPAYKAVSIDVEDYDTVFIGTPNWGGTIALPLATFIKDQDWTDKTVVPFLTHAGAGAEEIEEDLKRLCDGAQVKPAFSIYKNMVEDEVETVLNWIHTYA